jgi:hypothetical protein
MPNEQSLNVNISSQASMEGKKNETNKVRNKGGKIARKQEI